MCISHLFFFFQAEDGIRDLVRSRGLGDVYKRQAIGAGDDQEARLFAGLPRVHRWRSRIACFLAGVAAMTDSAAAMARCSGSVSYTHLTLPTSDLG